MSILRISVPFVLLVFFLPILSLHEAQAKKKLPVISPDERFHFHEKRLFKNADRPEAVDSLLQMNELVPLLREPERIENVCRRLRLLNNAGFELRLAAKWCLFDAAWRRGHIEEIKKARDDIGLITRWQVIGGFPNDGGAGHDVAFGVEKAFNPLAKYGGKTGKIGWRAFADIATTGYIDFKKVFYPAKNQIAYAYARLYAERTTDAVFVVAGGGQLKAWLNENALFNWDEFRPATRWQQARKVRLKRGVNHLLVKVGSAREGDWGFALALTDEQAEPLGSVSGLHDGTKSKNAAFDNETIAWTLSDKFTGRAFRMSTEILTRRFAKQRKKDAEAALTLSRLSKRLHDFGKEKHLDEEWALRALALDPKGKQTLLHCGENIKNPNRRYHCILDGQKLFPKCPRFQLQSAELMLFENQPIHAKEALEKAMRHESATLEAGLLHADLLNRKVGQAFALKELEALYKQMPNVSELGHRLAMQYERMGFDEKAFALYQSLHSRTPGDIEAMRALYNHHYRRRELGKAKRILEKVMTLSPAHPSDWIKLARLKEALESPMAAREVMREALSIAPLNPLLIDHLAMLEHKQGNTAKAMALWEKSLSIRPQNPDLKRYLRTLSPAAKGFEADYAMDAEALIERFPADEAVEDEVVELVSQSVYKVFKNGLSSRFHQNIVRVNTKAGIRAANIFGVRYVPKRQNVQILKARIIKPNGQSIERFNESDRSVNEAYKIYFDYRVRTIYFPDVDVGDVVEVQYRIDDIGKENLFSDYFGTIELLEGFSPMKLRRIVILMPRGKKLYYNKSKHQPTPLILPKEDMLEYEWKLTDVDKLKKEPNLPPLIEIADYVHVSTFADWEEMGRWYWRLIQKQFHVNDAIKKKALELTRDAADDAEKVRRIHEWVVSKTRYIGLEFGIHGFKPYAASRIFERKFGDCKDKATLMLTLLKAVGIEAWFSVIRTSDLGRLQDHPPSLASFNHAILYVPKFDLFLDGTAEFSGAFELPFYDRYAQTLLLADSVAEFRTTPPTNPKHNTYHSTSRISPDPLTGIASIASLAKVKGIRAAHFRRHFQDEKRREEFLEKLLNKDYPGLKLERFHFQGLDSINKPVSLEYAAKLPSFLREVKGGYAMPIGIEAVDLIKRFAPLSERTYPVRIDRLQTVTNEVRFLLPKGYRIIDKPKPMRLDSAFGFFSLKAEEAGDEVVVQTKLVFKKRRIAPEDYEPFRNFCSEVTRAFNQEMKLVEQ